MTKKCNNPVDVRCHKVSCHEVYVCVAYYLKNHFCHHNPADVVSNTKQLRSVVYIFILVNACQLGSQAKQIVFQFAVDSCYCQ